MLMLSFTNPLRAGWIPGLLLFEHKMWLLRTSTHSCSVFFSCQVLYLQLFMKSSWFALKTTWNSPTFILYGEILLTVFWLCVLCVYESRFVIDRLERFPLLQAVVHTGNLIAIVLFTICGLCIYWISIYVSVIRLEHSVWGKP